MFCSAKKKWKLPPDFCRGKLEVERGYITKEKPGKVEDTFVFRINETAYKNVQENKKIVMTGVI